jgi:hypothetical protein
METLLGRFVFWFNHSLAACFFTKLFFFSHYKVSFKDLQNLKHWAFVMFPRSHGSECFSTSNGRKAKTLKHFQFLFFKVVSEDDPN